MRRLITLLSLALPSTALAGSVTVGAGGDYATVDAALEATDATELLKVELLPGDHAAFSVSKAREVQVSGAVGTTTVAGLTVADPGAEVQLIGVSLQDDGGGRPALVELQAGSLVLDAVQAKGSGGVAGVRAGPSTALTVLGSLLYGFEDSVIIADRAMVSVARSRIADGEAERGAAIRAVETELHLDGVVFAHLRAAQAGGAVLLDQGSISATDVELQDVRAQLGGGFFFDGAAVNISDLKARGAYADKGAHIYAFESELTLVRADLRGGRAEDGAAMYIDGSGVRVQNALIVDHAATRRGGVIWLERGQLDLRQATVFGGRAPEAAGLGVGEGEAVVRGSVIAGLGGEAISLLGGGAATIRDSLLWAIEGSPWLDAAVGVGPTQMTMDPRFTNTAAKDFTLRAGSPGLDAGPLGTTDPDGTRADLGAYGGPLAWALADADADGFVHGRDCDDNDRLVHEAAIDRPYDGIDADCDMRSDFDQDRDGVDAVEFGGFDCDDTDPRIRPGARETPGDSRDEDCDGRVNPDMDRDGWEASLDCDDLDPDIRPDGVEVWYDGKDSDCDGASDFDQDGDGVNAAAAGGGDCDDTDAQVHGLMIDASADGKDQDCDGVDGPGAGSAPDETTATVLEGGSAAPSAIDPDMAELATAAADGEMTQTGCATTGGRSGGAAGLIAGLVGLLGALRRRPRA
jgi:hypothetical protein